MCGMGVEGGVEIMLDEVEKVMGEGWGNDEYICGRKLMGWKGKMCEIMWEKMEGIGWQVIEEG
jgi:hypothetical protein